MPTFDIFNGDADGICALHQLRMVQPKKSLLITGVKRDNRLLKRAGTISGDSVTVIDISLDLNRTDLMRILNSGAHVEYFDHHFPGSIPKHPNLNCHINTSSQICTSLIMDGFLEGRFPLWAITGAFGDNLPVEARDRAAELRLAADQVSLLQNLGELLNYNAYGDTIEDLYYHPDDLYRKIEPFSDPFEFIRDTDVLQTLEQGFRSDMLMAKQIQPYSECDGSSIFLLPDESWSRRVCGPFANQLVQRFPDSAIAVLHYRSGGELMVNIRTPHTARLKAEEFCRRFPTGGGRATAGGINALAKDQLPTFIQEFHQAFLFSRTS